MAIPMLSGIWATAAPALSAACTLENYMSSNAQLQTRCRALYAQLEPSYNAELFVQQCPAMS